VEGMFTKDLACFTKTHIWLQSPRALNMVDAKRLCC
jgi:hypothetical protein